MHVFVFIYTYKYTQYNTHILCKQKLILDAINHDYIAWQY